MFNPKTIALVGATDKEGSIGRILLENLLSCTERRIYPINPSRKTLLGVPVYHHLAAVSEKIDLAVIATPAPTVPVIVEECGKSGVAGVVVVSSGFKETGQEGLDREEALAATGKRYGMRIMGPDSLGFMRPHMGLNVTPVDSTPQPGNIAFISQSEGFGRALIDWGIDTHLGFSMFASLGSMIDIDLADLIDFIGYDPHTRSIMIYMEENIGEVKKFISAARGFARNKPIVLLRPAGITATQKRHYTLTGRIATSDKVYDAVFKRVGVVRVRTAGELFNTAGVLYSRHLPKGPKLLVMGNVRGVGVMAVNKLLELDGTVARLSPDNLLRAKAFMPPFWKEGATIDLLRDADLTRYREVLKSALGDRGIDGILLIYTPQGGVGSTELAQAVAELAEKASKPIITVWMGGKEARKGREVLLRNNVPAYDTPEEAVRTYIYMYNYERNLNILNETPAEVPIDVAPPKNNLKALVRKVLAEGRIVLTEEESRRFLSNYHIPMIKTRTVRNVEEAAAVAKEEGYPVVLKVVAKEIMDVRAKGGVVSGIATEEELRQAFEKMLKNVKEQTPGCTIAGVIVQRMIQKSHREIMLGAKKDDRFGSVILFGAGDVGGGVYGDCSIGLPPLNQTLAARLMVDTKVYRILQEYPGEPAVDMRKLEEIVLSFSILITDFPEIAEMDINPIVIAEGRFEALDVRIILDPTVSHNQAAHPHLVISPYPTKYISRWQLTDGTDVLVRPIRPEDEPLEHEMLTSLSKKTLKERFFQTLSEITHEMHVRFCNIDYEREIALVAEIKEDNKRRFIGTARLIIEPDSKKAEFAVVVHDLFQGQGLGYRFMDAIIGIGQDKGLEEIYGLVLSGNKKMLSMCTKLGFKTEPLEEEEAISRVTLALS